MQRSASVSIASAVGISVRLQLRQIGVEAPPQEPAQAADWFDPNDY